jgi:MFS family permease
MRRSWLLLGIIAADALTWTAVLILPGPTPRWLLVLLVVVLSAGGPGSVVGFDIARTSNPRSNLGVAQSMVNMGGFLATLFVLAVMGTVMTAMGGFTPEAFRVAWLVQYPVWLVAVIGVLVMRRQARGLEIARAADPRPPRDDPGGPVSHPSTDQPVAVAAGPRTRTGGSECATAALTGRPAPGRGARSV